MKSYRIKNTVYFIVAAVFINVSLFLLFPTDNEIGHKNLMFLIPIVGALAIFNFKLLGVRNFASKGIRLFLQAILLIVVFIFSIDFFPFMESGTPSEIYQRYAYLRNNKLSITNDDLLLNPTDVKNFERLLFARDKIIKEIDPKLFYLVRYRNSDSNMSDDGCIFYYKKDSLFSSKKDVLFSRVNNGWIIRDNYEQKAIEYFYLLGKHDKNVFSENGKLESYVSDKSFFIEQNNTIIKIDNILKQEDYFGFESYWVYKLMNRIISARSAER